jgi:hypothetical protein
MNLHSFRKICKLIIYKMKNKIHHTAGTVLKYTTLLEQF